MGNTSSGLEQLRTAVGELHPGRADSPERSHGGTDNRACRHNHHPTLHGSVPKAGELGPIPQGAKSSAGKESACNAGRPGSVPGSGRSAREGIGYPLPDSWASLVAQLVKSPPAMWETWVRSLGWEDPLEEGKVTHSSILSWVAKSWT